MARNKGLAEQDLSKLDVTVLHPLSPEVISRQATINIGKTLCQGSLVKLSPCAKLRLCKCYYLRNHWACRSRQVHCCESYFWCPGYFDSPFFFDEF